jgi:Ca2+-binding EF-hand superfamily protein
MAQEGAAKYAFVNLQKQEGAKGDVEQIEASRYMKALTAVYCKGDAASKAAQDKLARGGKTPMTEAEFIALLKGRVHRPLEGKGVPNLIAAMSQDFNMATGKLVKFRTTEEQLSKLLGNLDRIRWREAAGEKLAEDVKTRTAQVAKFRRNGVIPSPGLCVFAQVDFDKSGTISQYELWRLFKAMGHLFPKSDAEIKGIMATLDADGSGEIDEDEWIQNLALCPGLEEAMAADLDPDTGKLKSFRTPRQQFAKVLGNLDRLEYDASRGIDVSVELASRRALAHRYRLAGIQPSAGILVFQQLDKKKTRQLAMTSLQELMTKLKYNAEQVADIMKILDSDNDGLIDEKEWLENLDKVPSLKWAIEKDVDPETGKIKALLDSGKALFDMLRRQEGAYSVDYIEVGRYLTALKGAYKLTDAPGLDAVTKMLMTTKGKMTPDEWLAKLEEMPVLKKALEDDYIPDRVRFGKFRSCGQQLSKLFANLDRLRLRENKGENVHAEIEARKRQVKKMRNCGIVPSVGVSVFAQLDVDKSGTITKPELERLFKSLKHVYPRGDTEINELMATLDSDKSGDIDELEWRHNLAKCPGLQAALQKDLDPDTGKLRSYRSTEDQLAKLLGNIERLEYDKKKGKDVDVELASRKAQAAKLREKGVRPTAGIVVFNQIDKNKSRSIDMIELKDVLMRLNLKDKTAQTIMTRLDLDCSGCLDEKEFLEGMDRVQSLKAALAKDIDPDTGKLRCMSGLGNFNPEAVIVEQFQKFDKNKSGQISLELLSGIMMDIDPSFNKSSCARLCELAGGDGKSVAYAKFVHWLLSGLDVAASASSYVFRCLQTQEGNSVTESVEKKEAGRYVKAAVAVYCKGDKEGLALAAELEAAGGKMSEAEFNAAILKAPALSKAVNEDYNVATGKLVQFRTPQEQLSKLLGNLDRLRWRLAAGEAVAAEVTTRTAQVKKFRRNGVVPSPGLCVFNQVDFDKSRTISPYELWRLLKAMSHVFPKSDTEIQDIMKTLDADDSGEIDEDEWIQNLALCPGLEEALAKDLNPDSGKLRSFRTPRQQFAKILGNIDRLEYDLSRGIDCTVELASRRKQAQRYRLSGIQPSAGILVFQQLDKKKLRKLKLEDLKELMTKLKYDGESVQAVMTVLDASKDGVVDEQEWLEGLDNVPHLKALIEKDVDPETGKIKSLLTAGKSLFDMIRRQESAYAVDNIELGRYLKALKGAYKLTEAPGLDAYTEKMMTTKGKVTPDQWLEALETMPVLKKALEEDYMPDRVRFKNFRSCGQQLSKLFANLDRCRFRAQKGEDVKQEIETRKRQVRKMRAHGILPSAGVSVFAQLDLDKSGTITTEELGRLFKSLKHVYPRGEAEIADIMKTLDTDNSGDLSEVEWRNNLALCPGLQAALVGDLDPDTGHLKSYRGVEDQLAKLFGNIERLEYDASKGKDVAKELASRKEQAQRMRGKGIVPNAGIVVFNQIDKNKTRSIDLTELKDLFSRLKLLDKTAADVMKRLDVDENGTIDEKEWLEGLDKVQSLKAALVKDIDPDSGKLRCMM